MTGGEGGLPRIVMIVAQYPPVVGGAERSCQRLARALVERGYSVSVLTRRPAGLPACRVEDGIEVHRFAVPGGRVGGALGFMLGSLVWLARHGTPRDLIHAHQLLSPATIATLSRRFRRRPVLVKLACSGPTGDVALIRSVAFAGLRCRLLRGQVDGFVCLNSEMEEELTGLLGPSRVFRIPNGVDARTFAPAETRARARQRLGIEGRALVFTGVLRPQKRLDLAIDALAALPADVGLWIVGDGPERPRLETLAGQREAGGRVRFVGAVSDVRPWLWAADLYVLPSLAEGMSNSLLEAMAAGVPAVASDVPGNRDLCEGPAGPWLFAGPEPRSLAGAVRSLLDDPGAAAARAAASQELVLRKYDLSAVVDRYVEVYGELDRSAS